MLGRDWGWGIIAAGTAHMYAGLLIVSTVDSLGRASFSMLATNSFFVSILLYDELFAVDHEIEPCVLSRFSTGIWPVGSQQAKKTFTPPSQM